MKILISVIQVIFIFLCIGLFFKIGKHIVMLQWIDVFVTFLLLVVCTWVAISVRKWNWS